MRSKREIRRIVEGFAKSGMTRREYCGKHGVAMTTLDYWAACAPAEAGEDRH